MGRKTETDEVKVKKVYPDAECREYYYKTGFGDVIRYFILNNGIQISNLFTTPNLAWEDTFYNINTAKRKKYYKRKITRPNGEIKAKVTIMMYPSDRTAIIGKYGSVQKFINTIVEQLKTK